MTLSRSLALGAALVALAVPATAAANTTEQFSSPRGGEALVALTAAAPGADWGTSGAESAVVALLLDGRKVEDLVLFAGARPFTYRAALGRIAPGRHRLDVGFVARKSPPGARAPRVSAVRVSLAGPDEGRAARFSPIVVGRDIPEVPGVYENNHTDVPLLAYHTTSTDDQGRTVIEYTEIWSNEDGGTNTPALMARWGRTTDIEWIYRVTLGADGRPVSEVYQAPNHATLPFTGVKVDDHPVLRTATANNNMLQVDDLRAAPNLLFFPDTTQTLPAGRAREAAMDANPWTYQVMAKEMVREGKVEATPSPATADMSDQRDYLFAEVKKTTTYPQPPAAGAWVGTALEVKLAGDATWYSSNHHVPDSSIQRDDPAATTVELPAGTTPDRIEAIRAVSVPVAATAPPAPAPADYRIEVTALNRGFMLDGSYLPGESFVAWNGSVVLTPAQPAAVLWTAAGA
jgi:hypothetical protein